MGESAAKYGAQALKGLGSGVHLRSARVGALVEHPSPALERASYELDPHDPEAVEVAAALVGTMKATPGCTSISAPQLGYHLRIVCVDVSGHEEARSSSGLIVLANPQLLTVSGTAVMREECISFPHLHVVGVARAANIVVSGIVPGSGRQVVIHADGIEARRLLHELDHLDGITMLDRVEMP